MANPIITLVGNFSTTTNLDPILNTNCSHRIHMFLPFLFFIVVKVLFSLINTNVYGINSSSHLPFVLFEPQVIDRTLGEFRCLTNRVQLLSSTFCEVSRVIYLLQGVPARKGSEMVEVMPQVLVENLEGSYVVVLSLNTVRRMISCCIRVEMRELCSAYCVMLRFGSSVNTVEVVTNVLMDFIITAV